MSPFDIVIKNGMVIDGQMVPRRRADVAIKDGRIAEIGKVRASDAREVLDASGLIVAPGFVDLHTHYDAQLFYDPWASISGWHGVTSVAIGNCGFGFAPARKENREYLMRTLTRVEAIAYSVMESYLPWTWESFPQWMDTLDAVPKGVNVLTYVPLNPLLVHVMGLDAAKTRDATDDERREMQRILREAMDAGACGWSAQHTPPGEGFDFQRDHDGSSFAADLMSLKTALALGEVLSEYKDAFIQATWFAGNMKSELEQLAAVSDSAILYNVVAADSRMPTFHRELFDWMRDCRARGLNLYPQCATNEAFLTFTLEDWNLFDDSEPWREATLGTPEERLAKFKDPARQAAMRAQPPGILPFDRLTTLRTQTERFLPAKGTRVTDGARLMGYEDVAQFFIDMVVADELKTLFQCPVNDQDTQLTREVVVEPFGIWGVSDGGAHTKFLTTGSFPTQSIIDFVRERELVTLEEAHHRLSTLPAHCAGFKDRGRLVEGAPADIVVYDYENLALEDEEVAEDLGVPGEWRRIRKARGYAYILVNGKVTFEDGKCTGATPGQLLRSGKG